MKWDEMRWVAAAVGSQQVDVVGFEIGLALW